MTAAQERRARHNLAVLRRRVYLHDETFDPYDDDSDKAPPYHARHEPHAVWSARRKIPLIEARLRAAGRTF